MSFISFIRIGFLFFFGITNTIDIFENTYKTANQFFDQIASSPKIHVIFKHSPNVQYIIFRAYTSEHESTVHNQH